MAAAYLTAVARSIRLLTCKRPRHIRNTTTNPILSARQPPPEACGEGKRPGRHGRCQRVPCRDAGPPREDAAEIRDGAVTNLDRVLTAPPPCHRTRIVIPSGEFTMIEWEIVGTIVFALVAIAALIALARR